jgi:ATP-dependent protease HslVU (ClpYQ) peptidase subunit
VRDGLVCGAGNQQACFAVFRFIEEGARDVPYVPQQDPSSDHSFTVLWLRKDRSLLLYGDHFEPTPVLDDVYAIGSGDDIVRTALHLGKTPEEAMEIACELDLNTGPPVVVEKL